MLPLQRMWSAKGRGCYSLVASKGETEEWNIETPFQLFKGLLEGLGSVLPVSEHRQDASWFGGNAVD